METKTHSLVPYIYPLLVYLGLVRLLVYYSAFGVNIFPFLEFTEILTSFFDMLLFLCFLSAVNFFIGLLFVNKRKQDESNTLWNNILNESKVLGRFWKYVESFFFPIFGFAVAYLGQDFVKSRFDPTYETSYIATLIIGVAVFISAMVIAEINYRQHQVSASKAYRQFINTFIAVVVLTILIALRTTGEVKAAKENNRFSGTRIVLDDNSTIHSNDSYYFIGKTHNFVFVFSENKNETEVIPMSRIKSVTFVNN